MSGDAQDTTQIENQNEDDGKLTPAQQQTVDYQIGLARIKAREVAEAKFAQAANDAEQAKLEADQNWQKLADMQSARVKELEPLEAQVKAYTALIDGLLKDKIKDLGDAAKKAVEALPEALSAVDRLNWLNANEELFAEGSASHSVGTPTKRVKKQTDSKSPADLGHRRLRI